MGTHREIRSGEHSRTGVGQRDDVPGNSNIELQRIVGEHLPNRK